VKNVKMKITRAGSFTLYGDPRRFWNDNSDLPEKLNDCNFQEPKNVCIFNFMNNDDATTQKQKRMSKRKARVYALSLIVLAIIQ